MGLPGWRSPQRAHVIEPSRALGRSQGWEETRSMGITRVEVQGGSRGWGEAGLLGGRLLGSAPASRDQRRSDFLRLLCSRMRRASSLSRSSSMAWSVVT